MFQLDVQCLEIVLYPELYLCNVWSCCVVLRAVSLKCKYWLYYICSCMYTMWLWMFSILSCKFEMYEVDVIYLKLYPCNVWSGSTKARYISWHYVKAGNINMSVYLQYIKWLHYIWSCICNVYIVNHLYLELYHFNLWSDWNLFKSLSAMH